MSGCANLDDSEYEIKDFNKFLEEFIENEPYDTNKNEDLRVYTTYKTLYKIYSDLKKSKEITRKINKDFSIIFDTLSQLQTGLYALGNLIEEHEKINKNTKKLVWIYSILIPFAIIFMLYQFLTFF